MLRLALISFLMFLTQPLSAATVHVLPDETAALALNHDPFQETIDAFQHSYRDGPAATPLPVLRMSVQLPLLICLGWWAAFFLPRQRHRGTRVSSARLRCRSQLSDPLNHRA